MQAAFLTNAAMNAPKNLESAHRDLVRRLETDPHASPIAMAPADWRAEAEALFARVTRKEG